MTEESFKKIHTLFKESFVQNCNLDNDEVNELELETLEGLEPEEVYENLKELLSSLLLFKKSIKNSEIRELTQRLLIFEKMIQKLESDIRSHISIQHQMRLDMETYELKISELQRLKTIHVKKIEDLDKMLVDKEAEILKIKNKNVIDLEVKLKNIEEKFKKEVSSAMELERRDSLGKEFERSKKSILELKDFDRIKTGQAAMSKESTAKAKKTRFHKIHTGGINEKTKKARKNSIVADVFKTIENIPRKNFKHESPYIKKEMAHIRSASDLGLTQKYKLTIL